MLEMMENEQILQAREERRAVGLDDRPEIRARRQLLPLTPAHSH
jgi:hypothetical protein